MTRYMVIETFIDHDPGPVYRRFHERGRMLPDGLRYLDSWLARDGTRCFQLMETARFELFADWTRHWADLVEFEIVELGDRPAPVNGA